MNNYPLSSRCLLVSAIYTAINLFSISAQASDYSFLVPTGSNPPYAFQNVGAWSQASQWSGGQLPGSVDTVEVLLPQHYSYLDGNSQTVDLILNSATLNHDSGNDVIDSISPLNKADIRLSDGTLTLLKASTLNTAYTQYGGQLAGSSNLTINGASTINGGAMIGTGTTQFNGSATITDSLSLAGGRVLDNQNTLTLQAAYSNIYTNDGSGQLDNHGTVTTSAGNIASSISATFNNSGIVNVQNGVLRLPGGGNHSGSFVGPGVVEFNGGTHNLLSGVTLNNIGLGSTLNSSVDYSINGTSLLYGGTMTGNGRTVLAGPSINIYGVNLGDHRVLENQGTFDFQRPFSNVGNLDNTGSFDNQGTVLVSTKDSLSSIGTVFNNSGTVEVAKDSILQLYGGGTHNGSFGGEGTVAFAGGTHTLVDGVTLNNIAVGGTLDAPSLDYTVNGTSAFYGGTMSGAGRTVLQGSTDVIYGLGLVGGRVLENRNVMDFKGDNNNIFTTDQSGILDNYGTVRKSAGTNSTSISATFNNHGAVDVQTGSLRLYGGGAHSGSFGGAGVVEFDGGTHTLQTGASLNNIVLGGGNLDSSLDYTIAGTAGFYGGQMTGTGRTTLNGASSVEYYLNIGQGRAVENQSVLSFNGDNKGVYGEGSFKNLGTIQKTAGEGLSYFDAKFTNSGTVDVQSGTLGFFKEGTYGGTFTGDGTVMFAGTNTSHIILDGVKLHNIFVQGGVLTSSGNYEIDGTATFSFSRMVGNGTAILNGPSIVNGGFGIDSGRVLENHNMFSLVSGGMLLLNPNTDNEERAIGGTLVNKAGATIDFKGDGSWIYGDYGVGQFDNAGTVKKSEGAGVAYIDARFTNTGTIDVQSGSLQMVGQAANFTNDGNINTNTGASFIASSIDNTANGFITGTGTVALNGGTLTNMGQINPGNSPGTLTVDGNLQFTSTSALNIQIAGQNDFDKLIITGQAILGGTLNLYAINGYLPNLGDQFDFLLFANKSGEFDHVNLYGFNPSFSPVLATFGDHLQLSFISSGNGNGGGAQIPEPPTVWLCFGAWLAWMSVRSPCNAEDGCKPNKG